MKIGILSDTHTHKDNAEQVITKLIHEGAEFFIHAGDIVEVEVLEMLESSGLKYIAVYGNNDAHLAQYHTKYHLVQEPYSFKLANTTFKLMHLPFYMSGETEVVIFGHTHQFSVELTPHGTLFLNPGEACARNKGLSECTMLEVSDTHFLVHYYFKKENRPFETKEFLFERIQKR